MKSLLTLDANLLKNVRMVLTDIDDTLTTNGRLTAEAYGAMERLQQKGIRVVPITGRPAGWCDMIARFWPVDAVVGENGAFYMRYDTAQKRLTTRHITSPAQREQQREKLIALSRQILLQVPGAALASDQAFRLADLAIDFCEDVPNLGLEGARRIKSMMEAAGLTAKISSIHVNGWLGDYDKLSTTRLLCAEAFNLNLDVEKAEIIFVGDSPNDSPMFDFFPLSVGVANVMPLKHLLDSEPKYVTQREGGAGFAEVAQLLLED